MLKLRRYVYWSGFFLNASLAVAAYINSSLLASRIGETRVGLVYALTSLITLALALSFHRLVASVGVRKIIVRLLAAGLIVLGGLTLFSNTDFAVLLLAVNLIIGFLLVASLDLYLEHLSENKTTGAVRGFYLAAMNLAWLVFPFFASQLNARFGFAAVYLTAAVALLPFFYLAEKQLADLPRRHYDELSVWETLRELRRSRAGSRRARVGRVLVIDFLLNFFYATMVIYLPLLLHEHIGLAWTEIGIVLTIMLSPFVILDLVLGPLADRRLGEKELMIAGLAIAGLATLLIPFTASTSIWVWAALLFTTRVGAATIEITKESYLFKQIDSGDISVIFLSHGLYPLSYIVAPLAATLILFYAPLAAVFTVMGLVTLAGIPVAARLKDTR